MVAGSTVLRVVLFGPPGAGKGTQARKLVQRFGIQHISTGRILRTAVRARSAVGLKVSKFLVEGLLVPDQLVRKLAEDAILEAGLGNFLLDGYPRTIQQVKWLNAFLTKHESPLSTVLNLNLPEADIVARLSRRRVNPRTGENFHLDHKPPPPSIQAELVQRPDDYPEAIRRRLRVYEEMTAPVAGFFRQEGLLQDVDATGTFEVVHERVCRALHLPDHQSQARPEP